jgi:hypothetical protein
MNILPKEEFMPYMYSTLAYLKSNVDDTSVEKFSDMEYEKFRRVVDYMETTHYSDQKIHEGRKDFFQWFTEYDHRRNVDFAATFPEMLNFYNKCSKL